MYEMSVQNLKFYVTYNWLSQDT